MVAHGSEKDLQWQTWRDFTGGLYERGSDRDVPPNGLTRLEDAVPMHAGGLAPGPAWTTHLNTTAGLTISGLSTGGFVVMSGFSVRRDDENLRCFVFTQGGSTANTGRMYFGQTTAHGVLPSSFTPLTTHEVMTVFTPVRVVAFTASSSTSVPVTADYYGVSNSTNPGVWALASSAGTTAVRVSTIATYGLEAHQARLIRVAQPGVPAGFGLRQRIDFSNDGRSSGLDSTANRFYLAPNKPGHVGALYSRMPGDLTFIKDQTGFFTLQGAMASAPILYEACRIHPPSQISYACETPAGMTYLTDNEGVWSFNGGPTPTYLSSAIDGSPMTEEMLPNTINPAPSFLGQPAFGGNWLFTPKGYIRDFDTGAWFKTSPLNTSPAWPWLTYEPVDGKVWAARYTESGMGGRGLQILSCDVNQQTMSRTTAYTFEIPILNADAMTFVPRELEFYVEKQSGPNHAIDVDLVYPTASGGADTTQSLTRVLLNQSRHQTVRMQIPNIGGVQWLKIRPTILSLTTHEAPTLGYMRLGSTPGTRIPVTLTT